MYSDYPIDQISDTVWAILIVLSACIIAWSILVYIMRSKTLYSIAKRRGIPSYGMAWVPGLYVWTLGGIADRYDGNHGMKRHWRWVLLVLVLVSVAAFVATSFFAIQMPSQANPFNMTDFSAENMLRMNVYLPPNAVLPALVFLLAVGACPSCAIICRYKLFESCKPKAALRLLLLSLLVPFAAPFCLRSCLRWDAGVKCGEWSSENVGKPVLDGYTAPTEGYETEKNNSGDNYTPGE